MTFGRIESFTRVVNGAWGSLFFEGAQRLIDENCRVHRVSCQSLPHTFYRVAAVMISLPENPSVEYRVPGVVEHGHGSESYEM